MDYELMMFDHEEREAFRQAFLTMSHTSDDIAQKRREWWCFTNPHGGAFALFKSGNEIAATCYLGGRRLAIGGQKLDCFEIGETATAPAHQRKGLFSKLVKSVVEQSGKSNAALVYGTPNSQSTPGYAKLGFDIVESSNSWLFVVISPSRWLPFALPQFPSFTARGTVTELTAAQYTQITKSFSRLNVTSEAYLDWRFAKSPAGYRFFQIHRASMEFVCVVRESVLGNYATLVVSEYFLNGRRVGIKDASALLRRAIWRHFDARKYLGLYAHGTLPTKAETIRLKLQGVLPHRQLPICATLTSEASYPKDWFKDFQLSDCDIG